MVDNMIRLFESTARSFSTNGLGALSEASKCEVVEERNGSFELELEYHVSGKHYKDLELRRIIVAKPNPYADSQPFRIYDISKPINGLVTIKAEHISYDMSGYPVSSIKADTAREALNQVKENCITECPFEFSTDLAESGSLAIQKPVSMRALLGGSGDSILDVFGGEYEFDGYKTILHDSRGTNRGVTIRYGKNMTDLSQEENCSNVYTAVYPYFWFEGDENDEERLVELPDAEKKIVPTPGTYDFTRIYPLDVSGEWKNPSEFIRKWPSNDEMREIAQKYISDNELGTPKVSLTVSFEQLAQSKEYETIALLEDVRLCDTVNVEFPKLKVSATSKCIKTVYNVLTGKYSSIELGDSKSNLASSLVSRNEIVEEKINSRPTVSFMKEAVEHATKLISGGLGGYVVMHSSESSKNGYPDEILIMDTPDIATATKVWRWNQGGLGYSSKGYHGPYHTAITQEGEIVADFVKTGDLTANIIRGGTLTIGGVDNTDGRIAVLDSSNNVLITLSKNGIDFSKKGTAPVTKITNDTIKTTNVTAENLVVKAAKISGKLTAEQINTKGLIAENISGEQITGKKISGGSITGSRISAGSIDGAEITGSKITSGSLDGVGVTSIMSGTIYSTDGSSTTSIWNGRISTNNITLNDRDDNSAFVGKSGNGFNFISYSGHSVSKNGYIQTESPLQIKHKHIIDGSSVNDIDIENGDVGLLVYSKTYSEGVHPVLDNYHNCGQSDRRWKTIFAGTSEINTSDRNVKHDIQSISEIYEQLFFQLKPVSYMFNTGDRTHLGIIAQDLKKSMDIIGLTNTDLAAFCQDEKMKTITDEKTGKAVKISDLDEEGKKRYSYGIRYSEFIMLNTHMIQKVYRQIEEQQKEINKLNKKLEEVLTYIKERK